MRGGGGGVADAKPKYPPDASGGYNYLAIISVTTFQLLYVIITEMTLLIHEHSNI